MSADSATNGTAETPSDPVHIDGQSDLDATIADNSVVLVDFYADWCGPCQMLEPVIERLASETDAAVAKVDVDSNQQLAAAHGVRGVPTLALFANGDPVEEMVGGRSEEALRAVVSEYTR